jgi:hypothetical protein
MTNGPIVCTALRSWLPLNQINSLWWRTDDIFSLMNIAWNRNITSFSHPKSSHLVTRKRTRIAQERIDWNVHLPLPLRTILALLAVPTWGGFATLCLSMPHHSYGPNLLLLLASLITHMLFPLVVSRLYALNSWVPVPGGLRFKQGLGFKANKVDRLIYASHRFHKSIRVG